MPGSSGQKAAADTFRSPSGQTRGRYAATFTNDEEVSVFEDAKSELDEIKVIPKRTPLFLKTITALLKSASKVLTSTHVLKA